MEVRRIVDWQVTNRLLAVPGVSQVVAYGGDIRQYQVLVDPAKLKAFDVSLKEVTEAVAAANVNAPGGYLITPDREKLIRGIGRIESIEDLKRSVIIARNGTPVKIEDVADVEIGAAIKRGDGSFNGQKAIIVMINKQPLADTPTVTKAIEAAMAELKAGLPKDIKVTATFRQENYIDSSIENVREALVEGSIIVALILIPFLMNATNSAGFALQDALKGDSRFPFVQLRSGRAPGDADAAGVNLGHLDIELSEEGMKDREKTLEKLREEFAKLPGVAPNIGGFISHRMDEVLSGVRSAIAIKIFGPDLEQLRTLGQQVDDVMKTVNGIVDLQLEPQIPIEQIQIKFDRSAAARYGLTVGQLSEIIETALNGRVVSQVLENQQTFDLIIWLKVEARSNLNTLENLLVDTPSGTKIPLAQVAKINNGTGPNTINRENVSRLIVVAANAKGRDLRSVVNEIREKVNQKVHPPSGYYIQYAGQFEAEERATQNILISSAIAFVVITVIMYLSVKSIPSTAAIMINLPLALVGGVIAVALTGGIISIASLVGFITLFGVATRNGLLLVDNYNTKFAEGMPFKEVIISGSMERLNAILMTAFTSALGLAPLVVEGGPGKEILQPLSVVVLGGLFTSTALTLMVLPALYAKFGKFLLTRSNQQVRENGQVVQASFEK